jgi:prepilin-type N-terminal cleavage/methylation domain-containing protein
MNKQTGFTLIELAIVLVIIGLLLGGVLRGQELINSAKVKNMANDFKNTQVYIYGYQDKYKALPGDDKNVNAHNGGTPATPAGSLGNGLIDGTWDSESSPAASEAELFWQHVRLAGFAPGPTAVGDPNYYPKNADGGLIGVQSVANAGIPILPTPLTGAYVVCSKGILGKFVLQLDNTLDDGEPSTGSMRAYLSTTTGPWVVNTGAAPGAGINPSATYNVCMSF